VDLMLNAENLGYQAENWKARTASCVSVGNNVGFAIATIRIGDAVMSEGILWLGSVMTVVLVMLWLFVGSMHARAVWKREILWPGRDEDHDE